MKKIDQDPAFIQQLYDLDNDLERLIVRGQHMLSQETDNIVEDLILLNTKESKELATDIIDIQNEICSLNELYDQTKYDEPFIALYNEDEE